MNRFARAAALFVLGLGLVACSAKLERGASLADGASPPDDADGGQRIGGDAQTEDPPEDLPPCGDGTFDIGAIHYPGAAGSTYFVRIGGKDENDGKTPETAFATIQKGVDALAAGDTLSIGPGEYHESVHRSKLGSSAAPTTIRAEIPGTVVLRGDVPAPPFKPVSKKPGVYVADLPGSEEVQALNELDTLTILRPVPSLGELQFTQGVFYQDKPANKIYLTTTDAQPVQAHHYSLAMIKDQGLYLVDGVRLVIDGLAASGYSTNSEIDRRLLTDRATIGVMLLDCSHCVVRRVDAYLDGKGIVISSDASYAGDNLVERCVARGNDTQFGDADPGGIHIFSPRRDVVQDSVAFLNRQYGINIRGGGAEHSTLQTKSVMKRSLSWGNGYEDFKVKTGESNPHACQRCVSPTGRLDNTDNAEQSTFAFGWPGYGSDTIVFSKESNLDPHKEFADPDNYDYRLQATSRFRAAMPDGSDRGAFPYQANIFYVSPSGSDSADGLSVGKAWRTLSRATRGLEAGDTLYLLPGTYAGDLELELSGTADKPISIRGRGTGPVVLSGAVRIVNSSSLELVRLHFRATVTLKASKGISFSNGSLSGSPVSLDVHEVSGLLLEHNLFTGFSKAAVSLAASSQVRAAGNLFDNLQGIALATDQTDAVLYSDYNSFTRSIRAWQVGSGVCDVSRAQKHFEQHSRHLAPSIAIEGGAPTVKNAALFAGLGPLARPIGPYRERARKPALELIRGPTVHSVSSTTANIEWATSLPATAQLSWGPTPAVANKVQFEALGFASYSLGGLAPGKTYYLRIDSLSIPENVDLDLAPVKINSKVISFTTAASDPAPTTYYVSPSGDDSNAGTSDAPLRSIQEAADRVNVGDTVIVGAGTYSERVRIRASGAPGKPITFRSEPGKKVTLDGQSLLSQGFIIAAKSNLVFDGFYFKDFMYDTAFATSASAHWYDWSGGEPGQFNIYRSRDITLSRILGDGRGGTNRAPDAIVHSSENVLISNLVSTRKMSKPLYVIHSTRVRVEHSVFVLPLIRAFLVRNSAGESVTFEQNVFTDSLQKKAERNIALFTADVSKDKLTMRNNVIFLRAFTPTTRNLFDGMTLSSLSGVIVDPLFTDPKLAGGAGKSGFYADAMCSPSANFDFDYFMTTDATAKSRGIGLQPSQFVGGNPR